MKISDRNVSLIVDADGNRIVVINDIIFRNKQAIKWADVKEYLKQYIGNNYQIEDTLEEVYIGSDLPTEYSGSVYTKKLRGPVAKAKANAAQGIPELITSANNASFEPNRKEKHKNDARFGWYKYDSMFAIPIYDNEGDLIRYNIYNARMLIRHASSGKKYLYDIVEIKKETSRSCQAEALPGK